MNYSESKDFSQYNDFLDVYSANSLLSSLDKDKSVEKLLKVIQKHNLSHTIGLRLVHRHNAISDNEVMLEDAVFDKRGFALVTKASNASVINTTVVPNSWVLSDAGFAPMEYSRVNLLKRADVSPATEPEFFKELALKLRELGVSNLIGPALMASEFVEDQCPSDTAIMLEESALDDRANVLRFINEDQFSPQSSIETFWSAAPTETETSKPADPDKSTSTDPVSPKKVCNRFCPYVQDPPVHQGTYIHN